MKVIGIDDEYVIYTDSVKTYNKLPAQCYTVQFDKRRGFFLEKHEDLVVNEKVYGSHQKKVDKILNAFERSSRSLGAIASGKKGIGKSLLFRLLSMECIKKGMPVIIVDRYIDGIASYIEKIDQEVMVLFDEFDKTFAGVRQMEGAANAQTELLGLFDGISSGKKLFVITCNEIHNVSEFLVNRPGRFHYHFRFDVPSVDEIKEYMHDKLGSSDWINTQIEEIIRFSRKIPLNFDCLRAIAFELETGEPFKEAIKDLNILKMGSMCYDITLKYKDGEILTTKHVVLEMFEPTREAQWMYNKRNEEVVEIAFDTSQAKFDVYNGEYRIDGKDISFFYDQGYDEEIVKHYKEKQADYMTIKLCSANTYRYDI